MAFLHPNPISVLDPSPLVALIHSMTAHFSWQHCEAVNGGKDFDREDFDRDLRTRVHVRVVHQVLELVAVESRYVYGERCMD